MFINSERFSCYNNAGYTSPITQFVYFNTYLLLKMTCQIDFVTFKKFTIGPEVPTNSYFLSRSPVFLQVKSLYGTTLWDFFCEIKYNRCPMQEVSYATPTGSFIGRKINVGLLTDISGASLSGRLVHGPSRWGCLIFPHVLLLFQIIVHFSFNQSKHLNFVFNYCTQIVT